MHYNYFNRHVLRKRSSEGSKLSKANLPAKKSDFKNTINYCFRKFIFFYVYLYKLFIGHTQLGMCIFKNPDYPD
jgi:hypothetical protein